MMGRYGNGASFDDVVRICGSSEGDVKNATWQCFDAIESLHDLCVHPLTAEEKEIEKQWMDQDLGFWELWQEDWVMYDGTIVVLYAKLGLNGDIYLHSQGKLWFQCSGRYIFKFVRHNLTDI